MTFKSASGEIPKLDNNYTRRELTMTITESAYVAALEKKLIEAERALYGFRAIWNNYHNQSEADPGPKARCEIGKADGRESGQLYDGQLKPPTECED